MVVVAVTVVRGPMRVAGVVQGARGAGVRVGMGFGRAALLAAAAELGATATSTAAACAASALVSGRGPRIVIRRRVVRGRGGGGLASPRPLVGR